MTLSIGLLAKAPTSRSRPSAFTRRLACSPSRGARPTTVGYDADAVRRLAFIRHARQLGFSVEAIRNLLDLADNPERPCGEANALASRQLQDVETKIAQLETSPTAHREAETAKAHRG